MKTSVQTDLFASKAPLSWAIASGGVVYTAQIPIDNRGQVVEGGIEAQSKQVMDNLMSTLHSAGVGADAVLQVLIYVTDRDYLKTFNGIYSEYFQSPYPNRAAMVVAGLAREEMLVELVVYAAAQQ
ncbi:RidA family protein [Veronia nyctiphanis]|uniref:RidA family protein n=1 Tax=Veronia nyctiphanis TaxID=1278244 RepID=UPI0038B5A99A